jgi:hypothetical protein
MIELLLKYYPETLINKPNLAITEADDPSNTRKHYILYFTYNSSVSLFYSTFNIRYVNDSFNTSHTLRF